MQVHPIKKDGTEEEITCPKSVAVYNDLMGEVHRFYQRKERYQIGRRSAKWWHRTFYLLIDHVIINSFVLGNRTKETEV